MSILDLFECFIYFCYVVLFLFLMKRLHHDNIEIMLLLCIIPPP